MSMIEVTADNFKQEILGTDKPALVDFWAPWCGPCRMVGPLVEELADEMNDQAVFGKVNVDEEPELAAAYGVMSIPTLILFRNGAEVDRIVGARPKQDIREWMEQH